MSVVFDEDFRAKITDIAVSKSDIIQTLLSVIVKLEQNHQIEKSIWQKENKMLELENSRLKLELLTLEKKEESSLSEFTLIEEVKEDSDELQDHET